MRGLIVTALQDMAQSDERQPHPLVILPMLNVDGTVHGWYVPNLSLILTDLLLKTLLARLFTMDEILCIIEGKN
jgi:hypothetical protein